jgi:hypothetical protein
MGYFLGMVTSLTIIKSTARLASSESQASSVLTGDQALRMRVIGSHLPLTEQRWLQLNDLESINHKARQCTEHGYRPNKRLAILLTYRR